MGYIRINISANIIIYIIYIKIVYPVQTLCRHCSNVNNLENFLLDTLQVFGQGGHLFILSGQLEFKNWVFVHGHSGQLSFFEVDRHLSIKVGI